MLAVRQLLYTTKDYTSRVPCFERSDDSGLGCEVSAAIDLGNVTTVEGVCMPLIRPTPQIIIILIIIRMNMHLPVI
jgi:hypothetical protein